MFTTIYQKSKSAAPITIHSVTTTTKLSLRMNRHALLVLDRSGAAIIDDIGYVQLPCLRVIIICFESSLSVSNEM